MHNQIKQLEALVAKASQAIQVLKEENEVLKGQVELLGAARGRAASNSAAARELADFRAKVKARLARICAKIEKHNDLQPGLFLEEEDDDQ
jgi:hypothetical protein